MGIMLFAWLLAVVYWIFLGWVAVMTGIFWPPESAEQILASVAVVSVPLIFLRTLAIDKQSAAAVMQAKTDSQRRMTDAYARAVEQFANINESVRLVGLYALWKFAKEDALNHHIQVMQILCAFVRNPLPLKGWQDAAGNFPARDRSDIKAVIDLIARHRTKEQIRIERKGGYCLDFQGANLRGANFRDADLRKAYFVNSDMHQANFSWAILSRANFFTCVLTQTRFLFSDLRLTRIWSCECSEARFDYADMRETRVLESYFGEEDPNVIGQVLKSAIFQSTAINGVDFEHAGKFRAHDNFKTISLSSESIRSAVLLTKFGKIIKPGGWDLMLPASHKDIPLKRVSLRRWRAARGKFPLTPREKWLKRSLENAILRWKHRLKNILAKIGIDYDPV